MRLLSGEIGTNIVRLTVFAIIYHIKLLNYIFFISETNIQLTIESESGDHYVYIILICFFLHFLFI